VRPCSLPEQKDGKLASFWGASFNENIRLFFFSTSDGLQKKDKLT
jgi:hypothetical protein